MTAPRGSKRNPYTSGWCRDGDRSHRLCRGVYATPSGELRCACPEHRNDDKGETTK